MRACDGLGNEALKEFALGATNLEVEQHLRDCAHCRKVVTSLRSDVSSLDEAVRVLSNPAPSSAFRPRVLAEIAHTPSTALWSRWAWLGAMSGLLAALTLVVVRSGPVPERKSERAPSPDIDVSGWRSPTAALLYSESHEQLHRGLLVDRFHFDLPESLSEENNDEEHGEN